jgi:hypothetical protein
MARNGLRDGDLRSQMGVTQNAHGRWGVWHGDPTYHTHHPFLLKAAFQQYARLAGGAATAAVLTHWSGALAVAVTAALLLAAAVRRAAVRADASAGRTKGRPPGGRPLLRIRLRPEADDRRPV